MMWCCRDIDGGAVCGERDGDAPPGALGDGEELLFGEGVAEVALGEEGAEGGQRVGGGCRMGWARWWRCARGLHGRRARGRWRGQAQVGGVKGWVLHIILVLIKRR